jgi:hypothetical protein
VATNQYPDPGFESGALWAEYQFTASGVTDRTRIVSRTDAVPLFTNLITNPNFEVNTTGWSAEGGGTPSIARSTTQAWNGTASMLITKGTASFMYARHSNVALTQNTTYHYSAWVYPSVSAIRLAYRPNGVGLTSTGVLTVTPNVWQRIQWSFTTGAGITTGNFDVGWEQADAADGATAYVDGIMLVQGSNPPSAFFDGSSLSAFWTGTAHASTSVLTGTPQVISGDRSLRIANIANASTSTSFTMSSIGWHLPTVEGDQWSFSALGGYCSHPSLRARISAIFRDAAKVNIAGGPNPSTETTGGQQAPTRLSLSATAPPGAAYALLYMNLIHSGATAGVVGSCTFDEVMAVKNEPLPAEWFDGDSGGAYWSGARYYSSSIEHGDGDSLEEMKDWVPPYFFSEVVS